MTKIPISTKMSRENIDPNLFWKVGMEMDDSVRQILWEELEFDIFAPIDIILVSLGIHTNLPEPPSAWEPMDFS